MHYIDIKSWRRRNHFEFFSTFDHPHASMCANVDLTTLRSVVKQSGVSINVAIVYVLARAANAVREFRYRIRGDRVVEHEVVHPATTIMAGDDLFSFCTLDYVEDFPEFVAKATQKIAIVKEDPTLEDEPGRDDLLYMTAIPWVSFTALEHPMHLQPADSVPRIAWGKFFEEGKLLKMPLGAQAHHALVDGVHFGKFYAQVQDYLDGPDFVLGNA
jgi:chloramphenicol O-acetyltransferase type A